MADRTGATGRALARPLANARRFISGRKALAALMSLPALPSVIIITIAVMAVFARFIAPHDPTANDLSLAVRPPFWLEGGQAAFPLGTDHVGRDVFSRIIYGSRISLLVALVATGIAGVMGTLLGLLSGYFGGRVDAVIMRATDTMLAMPYILIALVIVYMVGPSLMNIIAVIALLLWAPYARQIRAEVLSLKGRDFVLLARVAGGSPLRIIYHHIFPNVVNTLIVLATLQVGVVIIFEAGLSFLGVGIPPPTPTWGRMVADGRQYIMSAWWLSTFPGIMISLTVLAANLMGDWLRDKLDPRLRQA